MFDLMKTFTDPSLMNNVGQAVSSLADAAKVITDRLNAPLNYQCKTLITTINAYDKSDSTNQFFFPATKHIRVQPNIVSMLNTFLVFRLQANGQWGDEITIPFAFNGDLGSMMYPLELDIECTGIQIRSLISPNPMTAIVIVTY